MNNHQSKEYSRWAIAAVLLASASLAFAATPDRLIQNFDTNSAGTGVWYGSSSVGWASAVGNPGGSLLVTNDIGPSSDTPCALYVYPNGGSPWGFSVILDLTQYKSLQFDVRYDATSDITVDQFNAYTNWPANLTNSAGLAVFKSGFSGANLSGSYYGIRIYASGGPGGTKGSLLGTVLIPSVAASGWVHVTLPLTNTALPNITSVGGFMFYKWTQNQGDLANPAEGRYWIDNVFLEGTTTPPPPPTLSMPEAHPGLNLFGPDGNNSGDRYSLYSVAASGNYSWVGNGAPVSYSFTVAQYPGNSHPWFELHEWLIPGTVGTESAPDWTETNAIYMDFQNSGNGTAEWTFRYKTNAPGGNGAFYSDVLATLYDPAGPVGTWTLTFSGNTSVTMTSPTHLTTNFTFSADKVAYFAQGDGTALPLNYYIGCRANNAANGGQKAILSSVQIQGSSATIDDNFLADSALNSSIWTVVAPTANGVQFVPATPNPVYWLTWTAPNTGFVPQSSVGISGPWSDIPATPLTISPGSKLLITDSQLPSANSGFFRVLKRVYSNLTVVLPGETMTATGKTGTPLSQDFTTQYNNGIEVKVYSTAADGVPVNPNNISWVWLSSNTDTNNFQVWARGASKGNPWTIQLNGGTGSGDTTSGLYYAYYHVDFTNAGSYTITASDTTPPTGATITNSVPDGVTVTP